MPIKPLPAIALHVALFVPAGAPLLVPANFALGQAPAAATSALPHGSGTVKTVGANAFVLTTGAGVDLSVAVPAGVPVLLVQPGSRDLKGAQPGTVADIAAGDRAIVNGTAGDSATSFNASRVIVMKSGAIAATRASEQAAWAQGVGGIVHAVDPAKGTVTLSSGMRTLTVNTTPGTSVKRYAGASVRFENAVPSTVAAIQVGDQIRVRGPKNADGTTITAEAIVAGSFSNFSGLLTGVDLAANTVTLKDLATKRTVTVAVAPSSNVRRLPAGAMGAAAARAATGAGAAGAGAGGGGATGPGAAGRGAAGTGAPPGTDPGAGPRPSSGYTRGPGGDLSRMISHLPAEALSSLKPGDAVMIVASNSGGGEPTAITLLSGVEQILAAHPSGETTLSPWNLGGGEGAGEGGGEGGPR